MSKFKYFNIEEAKAGKKILTRDGHSARIICFDAKSAYPILALIDFGDNETVYNFTSDGKIFKDDKKTFIRFIYSSY